MAVKIYCPRKTKVLFPFEALNNTVQNIPYNLFNLKSAEPLKAVSRFFGLITRSSSVKKNNNKESKVPKRVFCAADVIIFQVKATM